MHCNGCRNSTAPGPLIALMAGYKDRCGVCPVIRFMTHEIRSHVEFELHERVHRVYITHLRPYSPRVHAFLEGIGALRQALR
jgi:hypothetical protein